jgi:hypothetical protein
MNSPINFHALPFLGAPRRSAGGSGGLAGSSEIPSSIASDSRYPWRSHHLARRSRALSDRLIVKIRRSRDFFSGMASTSEEKYTADCLGNKYYF